jgi:hypothetical protein
MGGAIRATEVYEGVLTAGEGIRTPDPTPWQLILVTFPHVATKAMPWLLLVMPTAPVWILMAICQPAIPAGVWLGWRLDRRRDQRQLYRAYYGCCS